ncbi:MAG: TolC family protein, partial [Ferruginibacter sp.]
NRHKKHKSPVVSVLLLIFLMSVSATSPAQVPITLQAAIDTALKNNLLVKNEQLKAQYQQLLIETSAAIPKASLLGEAGQINSIYTDTKFGIAQSFSFPKVYTSQRKLLQEDWKYSLLNVSLKEALLKKQVAQVFNLILYVEQKKQLLKYADSIYDAFYKKAELRLAKGESNLLEKTSAQIQLGQINVQLNQLKQDLAILELQFQFLLNTTTLLVPEENIYKMLPDAGTNVKLTSFPDTASLKGHAAIKLIQQQKQIADANIQLEKSRLLPDLSVVYNNTSIRGTGADNKIYSSSRRFSSIQVGLGIPIFAKSQKAKIRSAAFNQQVAESNYASGLQSLQSEYQAAFTQYNKYLETVQYFERFSLKNASLITATANQQLANGSINYLEWVQLINQATTVKNDYVEAVKNLNESIIHLNYFTN